jgi:hypothetical protein
MLIKILKLIEIVTLSSKAKVNLTALKNTMLTELKAFTRKNNTEPTCFITDFHT